MKLNVHYCWCFCMDGGSLVPRSHLLCWVGGLGNGGMASNTGVQWKNNLLCMYVCNFSVVSYQVKKDSRARLLCVTLYFVSTVQNLRTCNIFIALFVPSSFLIAYSICILYHPVLILNWTVGRPGNNQLRLVLSTFQ